MATNSTTYYNLPVFAATDQPKWLVDWNTTMEVIDSAIAQAKTAGDNAQTTANANALAISGLSDSVSTMSTTLGTLTTNVTTITGNVQRINELIGNGTPTTTDKTIIGAINELKAKIDALAPGGAVAAAEVSYDNTDSGLTADDVQDAIDELNTKIEAIQPGGGADLNFTLGGAATVTGSGASIGDADVRVLLNADKSIGKIYGAFRFVDFSHTGAAAWTKVATISQSDLPAIDEAYYIYLGYFFIYQSAQSTALDGASTVRLKFNTNGSVDVEVYMQANSSIRQGYVNLTPCIYILKNLGD